MDSAWRRWGCSKSDDQCWRLGGRSGLARRAVARRARIWILRLNRSLSVGSSRADGGILWSDDDGEVQKCIAKPIIEVLLSSNHKTRYIQKVISGYAFTLGAKVYQVKNSKNNDSRRGGWYYCRRILPIAPVAPPTATTPRCYGICPGMEANDDPCIIIIQARNGRLCGYPSPKRILAYLSSTLDELATILFFRLVFLFDTNLGHCGDLGRDSRNTDTT